MKKKIVLLFLEWMEYATLQGFADHYHMSIEKARKLINIGEKLYLRGV